MFDKVDSLCITFYLFQCAVSSFLFFVEGGFPITNSTSPSFHLLSSQQLMSNMSSTSISLSCETHKSTSKQPSLLLHFFPSKVEDELFTFYENYFKTTHVKSWKVLYLFKEMLAE